MNKQNQSVKLGVRGRKMKVKRINDYTLQVMLQKDELTERGIGMMDLMGNQQQMEDFFQTVLDEVDPQHQFSMDQTVLFQVMPTNDGIQLTITKHDGDVTDQDVQEQAASKQFFEKRRRE